MSGSHSSRPSLFFLTLWLAFLLSLVSSSAFGVIVTLQWFSKDGTFTVRVKPLVKSENTQEHILYLINARPEEIQLKGVEKNRDEYSYLIIPQQASGMIQLLILGSDTVTVFPSNPFAQYDALFGVSASGNEDESEFRMAIGVGNKPYEEHRFKHTADSFEQFDVKGFLDIHKSAARNDFPENSLFIKYPPYAWGILNSEYRIPLSVLFSPSGAQGSVHWDSVDANLSLLNSSIPFLKKTVDINVLDEVEKSFPKVVQQLAPRITAFALVNFTSRNISVSSLIGEFKRAGVPKERVPVLSGGMGRSAEEVQAIDYIYGLVEPTPVAAPKSEVAATKVDIVESKKDDEFDPFMKVNVTPVSREAKPEYVKSVNYEDALIEKVKGKENYNDEFDDFVADALGDDSVIMADKMLEFTGFPIYRHVHLPGNALSDNYKNILYVGKLEDAYKSYPLKRNRVINVHNQFLPVPAYTFDFVGKDKLAVSVIALNPKAKKLTEFLTQDGSQGLPLHMAWNVFSQCLSGLQLLYKNNLFPASFRKETIYVVAEGTLGSLAELFFSAHLHQVNESQEGMGNTVPTQWLIKRHFEEFLKLFLELRTNQTFESLTHEDHELIAIDDSAPSDPIGKWRNNPKDMWVKWLKSAGVVHPVIDELDLVEKLAEKEPTLDTLQDLITLMKTRVIKATVPIAGDPQLVIRAPSPVKPVMPVEMGKHYMGCPKGDPLQLQLTEDVSGAYSGFGEGYGVSCDHPECRRYSEYSDVGPIVHDPFVFHCPKCDYDQCVHVTAKQVGVFGLPQTVQCSKRHDMRLVQGHLPNNNPKDHVIFCNGQGQKCEYQSKSMRSSHYYNCQQCGFDISRPRGFAGYNLCLDCAIGRVLGAATVYGARYKSRAHPHGLQVAPLRGAFQRCHFCYKEINDGDLGYACKTCKAFRDVKMCLDCAVDEIGFLGVGQPHQPVKQ